MVAIGGMFAVGNLSITEPIRQYLSDQTGAILTDSNGSRLFIWQESERKRDGDIQNDNTNKTRLLHLKRP